MALQALGILRFSAVNTFQSEGFKAAIHLPLSQAVGDLHSLPRALIYQARKAEIKAKRTKWTARRTTLNYLRHL